MSETQTANQKIEGKTRKKFAQTRENIKNILAKMRNNKHSVEETNPNLEEQK